jgi:acyl carrier protein
MDDTEDRLARCFSVIFPDLDEKQIRRASKSSLGGWDSVATVTLINVVEEEFGIQIDYDAEQFSSFPLFLRYLQGKELETRS